ncbi:hypothetical protein ETB97_001515 [Aspergillus alliaceus]|uniref:Uncharacterized protein n=1 Tax=Petromyces alliaceus TaxID=209559 RepID=A0A8H6AFG2_PETAA|nr:hypothetical protein ETB97_001515 [Aspergillus burnettii]
MEPILTATGDVAVLGNEESRANAPQLLSECHWTCPEAAELTRLTEKITEHFCFHHKRTFRSHGISEEERESFCTKLQEIRQIRNFAVHRVALNASTLRRYAKITLDVLRLLQRLGGEEFRNLFNDPMAEDYEASKKAECMRRHQDQQEKAKARLRKAERAEKARKQEEGAKLRKAERAEKARKLEEDAKARKAERAEKARKREEHAKSRMAER